jgi:hypothetical protein
MRFFFDLTSEEEVVFDYCGLEFNNQRGAIVFAQEQQQLLRNSIGREWLGWSLRVCTPEGKNLCILPLDTGGPHESLRVH